MPTEKPKDFLENFADRDFRNTSSVDVATVTKDANKDDLLFGKKLDPNAPPANDGEPEDDTFKWDESEAVVKKYGQGMWYTDVVVGAPPNARTFRYWGKTRTEVTQALIKAQANAVPLIEDLRKKVVEIPTRTAAPSPVNLAPDTKLPYDPVARKSPRALTQEEILNLQELEQSDPLKAYRIKFEALTGYTPEGFAEVTSRSDNMYARRIADEAAFAFQANHAETGDWEPTPGNTALIDAYLKERKWPVTSNNLEIAFQDLKRQGKLVMPAPEVPDTPAPDNAAPIVEEVPPPPPPVSPPAGSAPNRAPRQEADLLREAAAGLREMPLEEARSSLTDAFRRQRGAR